MVESGVFVVWNHGTRIEMLADGSVCEVLWKRDGWERWQFKNEHDCKEEERLACSLPYKKEREP